MTEPSCTNESIMICTPAANAHKKDFEYVFKPESEVLMREYRKAQAALSLVRVPVGTIDPATLTVKSDQKTFEAAGQLVLAAIANATRITRLIIMCHGWPTGIQLGFRSKGQRQGDFALWAALVSALKARNELESITLFACAAGSRPGVSTPNTGDGGFADLLRDATGKAVLAHSTVGHATRNPDLVMFDCMPAIGGIIPAPRGSAVYKNALKLLSINTPAQRKTSNVPPKDHSRVAFASLPLCSTAIDVHALLSSEPAS